MKVLSFPEVSDMPSLDCFLVIEGLKSCWKLLGYDRWKNTGNKLLCS